MCEPIQSPTKGQFSNPRGAVQDLSSHTKTAPTTPTIPTNAFHPTFVLILAFFPGLPCATQSRHALCIRTTNACPSGECSPDEPQERGLTTGWSQPEESICGIKKRVNYLGE